MNVHGFDLRSTKTLYSPGATVLPPKMEEAPVAADAAAEKAEPEVIGRKKEETEEEAAEGKGEGKGKGKEEKKEKK